MKPQSPIITALLAHIASECTPVDLEQRYRDSIDCTWPEVEVVGLTFAASRVIEELDPTAFRCGVADSIDSENVTEVNGEYYDNDELDKTKAAFIEEKEGELVELNDIRDEVEIARLELELDELNAHSF